MGEEVTQPAGETPSEPAVGTTEASNNLVGAATYLLGFITGIVFLVIEKKDGFVRFHAMQSTITFGALFVLQIAASRVGVIGSLVYSLLTPLTLILWIVLMYKAFSGERFKLPYVGEIAEQQLKKT